MRLKTSVTLSGDVVEAIDQLAGSNRSRSEVIEAVLRQFFRRRDRARTQRRELESLNRAAERLNAEAADVLEYQSWSGE